MDNQQFDPTNPSGLPESQPLSSEQNSESRPEISEPISLDEDVSSTPEKKSLNPSLVVANQIHQADGLDFISALRLGGKNLFAVLGITPEIIDFLDRTLQEVESQEAIAKIVEIGDRTDNLNEYLDQNMSQVKSLEDFENYLDQTEQAFNSYSPARDLSVGELESLDSQQSPESELGDSQFDRDDLVEELENLDNSLDEPNPNRDLELERDDLFAELENLPNQQSEPSLSGEEKPIGDVNLSSSDTSQKPPPRSQQLPRNSPKSSTASQPLNPKVRHQLAQLNQRLDRIIQQLDRIEDKVYAPEIRAAKTIENFLQVESQLDRNTPALSLPYQIEGRLDGQEPLTLSLNGETLLEATRKNGRIQILTANLSEKDREPINNLPSTPEEYKQALSKQRESQAQRALDRDREKGKNPTINIYPPSSPKKQMQQ
jgi:hypothetical protein